MFEVFDRHCSLEWMQETISVIVDMKYNYGSNSEKYTFVHMAVKSGLWRLLFEVFLDKYGFDVDFYKPRSKLTLLHVIAKYYREEWDQEL